MKIMLFTDLNNYFIKNIDANSIIKEAKEFFVKESCKDLWTERFELMRHQNSAYVIIPSNISCKYNIEKATENKFILFKVTDNIFSSIEDDDEKYILHYISKIREKN